jgi:hypothetical protein
MSQNRKLTSLVSVFALFSVTGLLAAACGEKEDGGGGSCAEIGARVDALQTSAAALTAISGNIKAEVAGACAGIAAMTAPSGMPSDDQVRTLCNAAKATVDAAITANVSVVVVPPVCTVDAQAQFACEGSCTAEADIQCDPGSVEVRCDPGELSVQCSGTCNVNAYCEGSAEVAVDCQGSCEGRCEGTCSGKCTGTCMGTCSAMNADGSCAGTCTGECQGSCEANCMGECKGSCKVTAMGGASCGANARCKGGCTGTATAPKCEANLKPPACEGSASAQCNADCEGSASLKATCTEPSIDIVGTVDAAVKARLLTNLPKLIRITGQGELALEAVGDIGDSFAQVVGQVGGCALELGAVVGQFTAAASATATAAASVSVSFEASASVSGSATAG